MYQPSAQIVPYPKLNEEDFLIRAQCCGMILAVGHLLECFGEMIFSGIMFWRGFQALIRY